MMVEKRALQQFYDDRVITNSGDEFLAHVGHTENGKPISQQHLQLMLDHVEQAMKFESHDAVLELCCGNGLFASSFCGSVRKYTGIDFSSALIEVAEKHHGASNVEYVVGDVTQLADIHALNGRKFSKMFMNASLQHFTPSLFGEILDGLSPFLEKEATLLLSCVPRHGRQKVLFGTIRKRIQRAYLKLTNRDIFGHWWSLEDMRGPAEKRGFKCQEHPIPQALFFSKYRFSVLLKR